MKWNIAAPFFSAPDDRWIDDSVVTSDHTFRKIPSPSQGQSWHRRGSSNSSADDWLRHYKHASSCLQQEHDGVITVFPQLALTASLRKSISLDRKPLIAWCFNLGECYPGAKRLVSSALLKKVSKFVVHSTSEIESYSKWLKLPEDRFKFVHLQRGNLTREYDEDEESPFILSMGSARRDYKTLFEALAQLNLPAIVVASKNALSTAPAVPKNVKTLSNLSHEECRELVQKARINVVPILNDTTASGQVTVIEAMMYGRPVIATRSIGTTDYITHDHDGILVPPQDTKSLAEAIERLWTNKTTRENFSKTATNTAHTKFSDESAAKSLLEVINSTI